MAKKNSLKVIEEEAKLLLEQTGISAQVQVAQEDDNYKIQIDTDENALLIGKHGNTLASLELVLSLIIAQKTGEFRRILLEVGGYRQAREDYLKDLADRLKEEVLATGAERVIRDLKPWERRVIHMTLSENTDLITESEGEERDRVLVIRKK